MSWATLGARIIDRKIISAPPSVRLVHRRKGTIDTQISCVKCRQRMIRYGMSHRLNSGNAVRRVGCPFCGVIILTRRIRLGPIDDATKYKATELFRKGLTVREVQARVRISSMGTAIKLRRQALAA